MILSKRAGRIAPSPTAELLALKSMKKEAGIDLLDFGAGEPDFSTPNSIKEAGIAAITSNRTRYTPVSGTGELKLAIAKAYRRDYDLTLSPDEILITPGSKYGLLMIMQCLIDEGDEVILPRPYWVSYPEMVKFCGGTPVYADHLNQPRPLEQKAQQYIDACSSRTRLVIINSPANPSGLCMENGEMGDLIHFFSSRGIMVVLDDCYRHIHFGALPPASPYQLVPQARHQITVVSSFSKSYAMTGWRIGYTVSCPELNRAMTTLAGHSTSNPCSISQCAATSALTGPQNDLEKMVASYRHRRDLVCQRLEAIGEIPFVKPDGTFYIFPDFSRLIPRLGLPDDNALARELLEKMDMIWAPGSAFGAPNHLRFCFAAPEDSINIGLDRLETYIIQHKA